MPKKDFTQTAFAVFKQATGEAPKQVPKPIKKAEPIAAKKVAAKKPVKKAS